MLPAAADEFAALAAVLRAAREQREPFPDAWPRAVAAAMRAAADEDERDRIVLRDVLTATMPAWRAAFHGAPPTPVERAVAKLYGAPLAMPEAATDGERLALMERLHADGASFARIARTLGVNRSTVRAALTYEPAPPRPTCPRGHPLAGDNLYAHAIRRQGFAGTSPVAGLERGERPRDDDDEAKLILSPSQLGAVVEHADPLYADALAFMAGTGCRIGEALGLTWGDVDTATGTARFSFGLSRRGERVPLKTRKSRRTVDLPGDLAHRLRVRKLAAADTSADALVFASGRGGGLDHRNVARRGLEPACRAAGVPVVTPHTLRHSHASALIAAGEPLPMVSERLGHANVNVTATVYAHALRDAEARQRQRSRLDSLYGAAPDDGPALAVVT